MGRRCRVNTFARFRVSTQAGLSYTGLAADGEVEDYEITIEEGPATKWVQEPDPASPDNLYFGWNDESVYGGPQLDADDWVCTTSDPVTEIVWWGSFLGWTDTTLPPEAPGAFEFTIWTDVPDDPGDPDDFSHPGQGALAAPLR